MAPSLSVIIATKNRPEALANALRSIEAQTVQPSEVIVIDQSPGAPYASISGSAVARNAGIERARGDVLLFLDDDVTLHPDFVEKLLASYRENPTADGISGIPDNYSPPGKFYFYWQKIFMRGPFHDDRQPIYWSASKISRAVPVSRMSGGMMSIRRSAMKGTRFDSNLRGVSDGEDVDFCVRLNGSYFIEPRCKLTHHFDASGREECHWVRRHARSHTYLHLHVWPAHRISYGWLRAGWMVAAAMGCLSRRSLSPWRSMKEGIAEGCGCVKRPH
jgi:glycosyltransferase involved in cell wall biosynthesis